VLYDGKNLSIIFWAFGLKIL